MSYHGYFTGDASDPQEQQQTIQSEVYQPYMQRSSRIQSHTGGALSTAPPSPFQTRPPWTSSHTNYPGDLSFYQSDSSTQYYTLSSALNSVHHIPFSDPSQHAYSQPSTQPSKIEIPVSCPQPSSCSTYPSSSFNSYHSGYIDNSSHRSSSYQPATPFHQDTERHPLDGKDLSQHSFTDVKEEPHTPTSPQFIFEFPGGEDDPPPFELPCTSVFCEPDEFVCDATPRMRPSTPTTEAMRSMMSVFRVDPFASYDTDSGTRRKRRKRASTYAQTTNPEANSKEPPLIFSFQLDVNGHEWESDPEHQQHLGQNVEENADCLEDLYSLPLSDADPQVVHADFRADIDMGPYRIPPAEGASGTAITSPSARMSMPIPLKGSHSRASELFFLNNIPSESLSTADSHSSSLASSSFSGVEIDLAYPDSLSPSSSGADEEEHVDDTTVIPIEGISTYSPENIGRRGRNRIPTKMHVCWICHKEFPRPSGLATHMNTHSGAKPFKCPLPACAKTFAVRSNARRHLRTHAVPFISAVPPSSQDCQVGFDSAAPELELGAENGESECSGMLESPTATSSSSPASPNSLPTCVPQSLATRSEVSRLSSHHPFDDTLPFSFVSVPPPPVASRSLGGDTTGQGRDSFMEHGLQYPCHPSQFMGLSGPKSTLVVSIHANPVLATAAGIC